MSQDTGPQALRRKNQSLRRHNEVHLTSMRSQRERIQYLEDVIEDLFSSNQRQDDDFDTEGEDSENLPHSIYDPGDGVNRCVECSWEVVESFCQQCGKEHLPDIEDLDDPRDIFRTASTDDEVIKSDRYPQPRGDTPLRDVPYSEPPLEYLNRVEEYEELLARGATRLMCQTFCLEFSEEGGIIAWADDNLYETFSGPAMQKGDFWKICLGRRIDLDEDDLDGAQFVEDLLEETMIFPFKSTLSKLVDERWETVEETPGIWVTRPMEPRQSTEMTDSTDDGEERELDDLQEFFAICQQDDNALEVDSTAAADQQQSAIRANEYESSEVGSDEGSDGTNDEPDWSFHARVPDTAFSSDDDEEVDNEGDLVVTGNVEDESGAETSSINIICESGVAADSNSDSSVDSDFDDNDMFSGDESVLRAAGK